MSRPDLLLSEFLETVFIPLHCQGKHPHYAAQFRAAVAWLANILERQPTVADLTPATIDEFVAGLLRSNLQRSRRYILKVRLGTIWRYAAELGYVTGPRGGQPAEQRRTRCDKLFEPVGEPGTLVHFFSTVYRPQALAFASNQAIEKYFTHLRMARRCFGRDILVSELSSDLLAKFVAWVSVGRKPSTIRDIRGSILALWRMANDEGLAPVVPRFRPIVVPLEEPDAWTLEELTRIVRATDRIDAPDFEGVPARKWWRAILLTGWYTALRRSSLLALRGEDVDLSGWLRVPADRMKNKRSKTFKLGTDALEAILQIAYPQRELIFPAPDDGKALCLQFRELLALAGVPHAPRTRLSLFHKLRRSAVSYVCASAGQAAAIALAGHSGADVNKRYLDPRIAIPKHDATAYLPSLTDLGGRPTFNTGERS